MNNRNVGALRKLKRRSRGTDRSGVEGRGGVMLVGTKIRGGKGGGGGCCCRELMQKSGEGSRKERAGAPSHITDSVVITQSMVHAVKSKPSYALRCC